MPFKNRVDIIIYMVQQRTESSSLCYTINTTTNDNSVGDIYRSISNDNIYEENSDIDDDDYEENYDIDDDDYERLQADVDANATLILKEWVYGSIKVTVLKSY